MINNFNTFQKHKDLTESISQLMAEFTTETGDIITGITNIHYSDVSHTYSIDILTNVFNEFQSKGGKLIAEFPITPVAAPRQSHSDRWKVGFNKRPSVAKFHQFRTDIINYAIDNDFVCPLRNWAIRFYMPFPKSYSKAKREQLAGKPHTIKPDVDNLIKAFLDSLFVKGSRYFKNSPEYLLALKKPDVLAGLLRDDCIASSPLAEKIWTAGDGKIKVFRLNSKFVSCL